MVQKVNLSMFILLPLGWRLKNKQIKSCHKENPFVPSSTELQNVQLLVCKSRSGICNTDECCMSNVRLLYDYL